MYCIRMAFVAAVAMMILFVLGLRAWTELWGNLQTPSTFFLVVMFVQGTVILFVQFVNFAAACRSLIQYEKDNMRKGDET